MPNSFMILSITDKELIEITEDITPFAELFSETLTHLVSL